MTAPSASARTSRPTGKPLGAPSDGIAAATADSIPQWLTTSYGQADFSFEEMARGALGLALAPVPDPLIAPPDAAAASSPGSHTQSSVEPQLLHVQLAAARTPHPAQEIAVVPVISVATAGGGLVAAAVRRRRRPRRS